MIMKKRIFKAFAIPASCMTVCLLLSSCYTTSYYHGRAVPGEAYVKVNSVKNHSLILGLVPVGKNRLKSEEYVNGHDSYVVKHRITFADGLLYCVTGGLYTPSTTTFYLPVDSVPSK